jgi:hypothetical protein
MQQFETYVRSFDFFGHNVDLVFGRSRSKEEEGSHQYQTFIGGLVSLFIRVIVLTAVFYFTNMMLLNGAN